jgi:hypothetical protein
MEDLETCYLCEDRFGFVVIPRKTFIAIESCDLVYNVALHSFLFKNTLYVIPNYYHILN